VPLPHGFRAVLISVILQVLAGAAFAENDEAARVALVIGNSGYAANPLINPVNDAEDMATRLQEIGYDLYDDGPMLEQDLRGMQVAIRDFTRSLNPGDLAVVYYSGHGFEYKGTNYLIPIDNEEIQFADDVPDWSYAAPRLLERIAASGATGVIILDACRNNPLPERGGVRDAGVGLARMETPAGASAFIMYSAGPGQTASDGEGRNGLFTAALLEALEDPHRRIDDIMYEVSYSVRNATQGRQVPWLELAFAGEIPPHLQAGDDLIEHNEVPEATAGDGSGKPGRGILSAGVPLYGTIALDGPPEPEGLRVDLLAGGYENAAQLGGDCQGFVASNPDFQMTWTEQNGPITLRSESDAPTVMVMYGPDQEWICAAGGPGGRAPLLELNGATEGSYRIWIGTVLETDTAPDSVLVIEPLDMSARPIAMSPDDRGPGGEPGEGGANEDLN